MVDSIVRKNILVNLLKADLLRYTEIRPEGVADDLYNYHLKILINRGYIEKVDKKYRLSNLGQIFISETYPVNPQGRVADRFKQGALCLVIREIDKQIYVLNQKRLRQPFYGKVGIIGGGVRRGERIIDAAKRKLMEEAELSGEFEHLGTLRHTSLKGDEVFQDRIFHICITYNPEGELLQESDFGLNSWETLEQTIENEKAFIPNISQIVQILEKIKNHQDDLSFRFKEEVFSF